LSTVIEALGREHGAELISLIGRSVLVVDGERVAPLLDPNVPDGSVLEILPPYAGG
jgi:molybdopterin converting factor small subunit